MQMKVDCTRCSRNTWWKTKLSGTHVVYIGTCSWGTERVNSKGFYLLLYTIVLTTISICV